MKKLLLIPIAVLLFKTSTSQTANFFVDGSIWTYYTSESYEPGMCTTQSILEKDSIQGDTLINSLIYKKLFVTSQVTIQLYPPCWFGGGPQPVTTSEKHIRFDSLTKRVYMVNDTGTFYPELLIYDFNLLPGDTTPMGSYPFASAFSVIDSIDTILIFGIPVRKFYLPNYALGNYIIEGIGGSNGLTYFNPKEMVLSGGIFMTELLCFQSGDSIYPSNSNCPQFIPVGVSEIYEQEHSINIWPNPFTSQTTIGFSKEQKNTIIRIRDVMGKEVNSLNFSGQQLSIERGELSVGIYFIQVTDEKKNIVNRKIIIE